jgi:hypothetical protein
MIRRFVPPPDYAPIAAAIGRPEPAALRL